MEKVKTFRGEGDQIDVQFNAWTKNNPNIEIVDRKFTSQVLVSRFQGTIFTNNHYTLAVFFKGEEEIIKNLSKKKKIVPKNRTKTPLWNIDNPLDVTKRRWEYVRLLQQAVFSNNNSFTCYGISL